MYLLKENIENKETIIKKSKFITYLYHIDSINEVKKILSNIKDKYKDATHICYAYIINNNKKYFDDNEPNGTAGIPILNVLEKKDITNVLAIVIRYFGGIKLGAGGLVRAYSKSIKDFINNKTIIPYIKYEEIILTTSYENIKLLNNVTSNIDIIDKIFDEEVIYKIRINKDNKNSFIDKCKNLNIKIK